MIYLIWAVISHRKKVRIHVVIRHLVTGAFMCGNRGSGYYSLGAHFGSNYKIKMLSVIKTVAFILLHHSDSAKRCKSVLNLIWNLCSLLFLHPFCLTWLVRAGKRSHLHDSVLDFILSAKSEEVNMGKNWPLWFLLPLLQLNPDCIQMKIWYFIFPF